jgi:hypothetical protein
MIALGSSGKRRGRLLFVNKKNQKNFYSLGRAGFRATGFMGAKVFAPLFSKSVCFPLSQLIYRMALMIPEKSIPP